MTDPSRSSDPALDAARAAFRALNTPEKATFALEAVFGAAGEALSEAGRKTAEAISTLADEIGRAGAQATDASPAPEPPAAAPPRPDSPETP